MALKRIVIRSHQTPIQRIVRRIRAFAERRPAAVLLSTLGFGAVIGIAVGSGYTRLHSNTLQASLEQRQDELALVRQQSQAEVNALAARLAELQAQANRLNALGQRLTEIGKLQDGEFDFEEPVGVGGNEEPTQDMSRTELRESLGKLEGDFSGSGRQLEVLAALMFDRQIEQDAVPSRLPIHNSYITSGFGRRADPFRGGAAEHKGIDFHARVGDPVLSVADGVVGFAGVRSGYGNVVEIDHGNGYLTRYAHNSRLVVKAGDLVRAGQQIARAGSTGRSTGAHVHFEVWRDGRVMNPRRFLGDNPLLTRSGRA